MTNLTMTTEQLADQLFDLYTHSTPRDMLIKFTWDYTKQGSGDSVLMSTAPEKSAVDSMCDDIFEAFDSFIQRLTDDEAEEIESEIGGLCDDYLVDRMIDINLIRAVVNADLK